MSLSYYNSFTIYRYQEEIKMSFVRQSKFRHVFCKPIKKEFCLDDVRISKISWDSTFAAVNSKFIAVITEGAGGPFIVVPISKVGVIICKQMM
jgi:hypothetical protein